MIALSWSRISDYRQCPAKFKLKYLDKAPNFQLKQEDKNVHLVRGDNVHKALKKYADRKTKEPEYDGHDIIMPELMNIKPLIDAIIQNYNVQTEQQIAIDSNFQQVSWYAKDAWFRVIYDIVGFGPDLFLGDYKTGKFADYSGSMDELGQLHFSALIGMALWPEYDKCSSLYMYVDHKRSVPCSFRRETDLEPMKEKLIAEHEVINSDDEFPEKKNRYCGYCEATSAQCIHKQ